MEILYKKVEAFLDAPSVVDVMVNFLEMKKRIKVDYIQKRRKIIEDFAEKHKNQLCNLSQNLNYYWDGNYRNELYEQYMQQGLAGCDSPEAIKMYMLKINLDNIDNESKIIAGIIIGNILRMQTKTGEELSRWIREREWILINYFENKGFSANLNDLKKKRDLYKNKLSNFWQKLMVKDDFRYIWSKFKDYERRIDYQLVRRRLDKEQIINEIKIHLKDTIFVDKIFLEYVYERNKDKWMINPIEFLNNN